MKVVGFVALYAQLVVTAALVPWSRFSAAEPVYLASISAVVTTLAITLLHALRVRDTRVERAILALFLGGMPLVYLGSWALAPAPGWLSIELVGLGVYAALAVAGYRRSPWILAGGIAAHGLLWDAWHHGRTPFVPDWYALGCLVADIGLSIYVATQAKRLTPSRTQSTPRSARTPSPLSPDDPRELSS